MATANPALREGAFLGFPIPRTGSATMSVAGTVLKTGALVAILSVTAGYTWMQFKSGQTGLLYGLLIAGSIGGLIASIATIWSPRISPVSAPIYAALEGLVLGAISSIFEANYPGIAFQALALSVGTLTAMHGLYATGILRATEKFRAGIFAATAGIALVYLVGFIASFFGPGIPYIHESGPIGIGFPEAGGPARTFRIVELRVEHMRLFAPSGLDVHAALFGERRLDSGRWIQ